jgi:GT2 family glycosyltransferase
VIVLGHNGREYLEGCLQSLLDQDFVAERYEVIWADNGSTDGSRAEVRTRFPSVRVLEFGRNLGFARGNNRAWRKARGRYLVFVNQDIVAHRGLLRGLLEAVKSSPELVACQAVQVLPWHDGFYERDRDGYPSSGWHADIGRFGCVVEKESPLSDRVLPCTFLSGACFAIDREFVRQLPYLFDPVFGSYSEDLDLSLRIRALGFRVGVAPRAVVFHLQPSRLKLDARSLAKAYLSTRNRILAYYKALPLRRFLRFLPALLGGGIVKVWRFRQGTAAKAAYAGVMAVVTVFALMDATRLILLQYRGSDAAAARVIPAWNGEEPRST